MYEKQLVTKFYGNIVIVYGIVAAVNNPLYPHPGVSVVSYASLKDEVEDVLAYGEDEYLIPF